MNAKFFYRSVDLINSISKKIVVNNLIKKQDRILLAFSGGQDSICLLFLLNQLYSQMELNLALFWCHHLWQKESFSLMEQIAKLSFLFQFNSCFAIPSNFISSELLARKWRHNSSYRVSSYYNYSKICLAHTSNDKIETLFLNLLRGSGLSGLSPLRWTQFVSKNFIEKEEHSSQIFEPEVFPFFWFFTPISKKKKHICLTKISKKFEINADKINTFFLFCWKPNLYNSTTNLTNVSVLFTIYSAYCYASCKAKLCTCAQNSNKKKGISIAKRSRCDTDLLSLQAKEENLEFLEILPFYCLFFGIFGTNSIDFVETSYDLLSEKKAETFQISKIPIFTNFSWKFIDSINFVDDSEASEFKLSCSVCNDNNCAFEKCNNEAWKSLNILVSEKENQVSTESIDLLSVANQKFAQEVSAQSIKSLSTKSIESVNKFIFNQSTLSTSLISPATLLTTSECASPYFAPITHTLVIKSDFLSLKFFQFFSRWVLKKIILKKYIKKFSIYSFQSCFGQKKVSHFAMCKNKKKRNIKNKKKIKAKKWFNCVSYTFFKSCSTYL